MKFSKAIQRQLVEVQDVYKRQYYYLKLKENYFDDDSIVLLESMQDLSLIHIFPIIPKFRVGHYALHNTVSMRVLF